MFPWQRILTKTHSRENGRMTTNSSRWPIFGSPEVTKESSLVNSIDSLVKRIQKAVQYKKLMISLQQAVESHRVVRC
jgi:hypothetical protein